MGKVLRASLVVQRGLFVALMALALCLVSGMFVSSAWASEAESLPDGAREVTTMIPVGGSQGEGVSLDAACGNVADSSGMNLQAGNSVPVGVVGNVRQTEGRKILSLVNAARAKVGASALNWDIELEATAIQRAAELMLLFSHTRPDSQSCFTAFPTCGTAGENIAWGAGTNYYGTATWANTAWTNSSGHYANMINKSFTAMGAACVQGYNGAYYWVEVFSDGAGTGIIGNTLDRTYSFVMETDPSLLDIKFEDATVAPKTQSHMLFVSKDDLIDGDVFSYSSSNEKVAGVSTEEDSFGALEGRTFGTATMTVNYYQTTQRAGSFKVTVNFDDTPTTAWYMSGGWLSYALEHDLMKGYSGSASFGPNGTITRGQVATIIYRAATGISDPNNNVNAGFKDVPSGAYYTAAVKWASDAGIVRGFGDTGTFAPNAHVTREQLATMLGRYAAWEASGGTSVDALPASSAVFNSLADSSKAGSYAVPYLVWCTGNGVMNGSGGKLNPGGIASRAEMAKMVTVVHRDVLKKG